MLTETETRVKKTLEARKEKIGTDAAWNLFREAREVVVAKGKSSTVFHPEQDDKAAILGACMGRSGTLRAPTLKVGDRYLVGFNEQMYRTYLS